MDEMALAKVAHDAYCADDDWDELDNEEREVWRNVVLAVCLELLPATA